VPGYGLTFEQACEIIKVASGEDTVKRFEEEEDCYFEFRRGQFMVSEECFIAREWSISWLVKGKGFEEKMTDKELLEYAAKAARIGKEK